MMDDPSVPSANVASRSSMAGPDTRKQQREGHQEEMLRQEKNEKQQQEAQERTEQEKREGKGKTNQMEFVGDGDVEERSSVSLTTASKLLHLESTVLPPPSSPSSHPADTHGTHVDRLPKDVPDSSHLTAEPEARAATTATAPVAAGMTSAGRHSSTGKEIASGGGGAGGDTPGGESISEPASDGYSIEVDSLKDARHTKSTQGAEQQEAAPAAAVAAAAAEATATAAALTAAVPSEAAKAANVAAQDAAAAGDAAVAAAAAAAKATQKGVSPNFNMGSGHESIVDAPQKDSPGGPRLKEMKNVGLRAHMGEEEQAEDEGGSVHEPLQHHSSTDESVSSETIQQHDEPAATWPKAEEDAAVAAASAAVEEGVDKKLVAAAERTSAATVKSRGPGSPRLRLYIMRQCSEEGGPLRPETAEAAVAAAAALKAEETSASALYGVGGGDAGTRSSSKEAREGDTATESSEKLLQATKHLLTDAGASGKRFRAAHGAGASAGRPSQHLHHLHGEDEEEEEERNAAPNDSTCSNKAWSRRRYSKGELMSISAADRDQLLLDTGSSLEEIEETWWKSYFGDVEALQQTRAIIAARREALEKHLQQQQQGKTAQQQQITVQHKHQEDAEEPQQEAEAHQLQQDEAQQYAEEQHEAKHDEAKREEVDAHEEITKKQQRDECETENHSRGAEKGLLSLQNWWEETVENTGNSYISAADKGGRDSFRLSYREVDRCANAVALWAMMTLDDWRRRSTGSTTARSTSTDGSSTWNNPTLSAQSGVNSSYSEQPTGQQEHALINRQQRQQEGTAFEMPLNRASIAQPWGQWFSGHAVGLLQPNAVVVLLLSHPLECLLLLLGLAKANLIPALVPTHLKGGDLKEAVEAAQAACIICDVENYTKLWHLFTYNSRNTDSRSNSSESTGSDQNSSNNIYSSREDSTIPAVGSNFFSGGEGVHQQKAARQSSGSVETAAGPSRTWFACPIFVYGSPVTSATQQRRGSAATAAEKEPQLLQQMEAVLGDIMTQETTHEHKEAQRKRQAAEMCGVILPPQCPPVHEVLQISAATRLACRGNTPCLSCLRRDVKAHTEIINTSEPGTKENSKDCVDTAQRSHCSGGGGTVPPRATGARAGNGGPVKGKNRNTVCVYAEKSFATAAVTMTGSSRASQWGARHPGIYFYATVPVGRGSSCSKWQQVTAAEMADAAADTGTIERGLGGAKAEEQEELERSLQPALISHESLIHIGIAWKRRMQLSAHDVVYCPVPLQSETGCLPTVLAALEAKASLVFPHVFDASCFWNHIDHFQCTYTTYFPNMWGKVLAAANSSAAPGVKLHNASKAEPQGQQPLQGSQQEQRHRCLRGCAGEGMTPEWWQRVKETAGATLKGFVEYHFRPHWPVSSPLINFSQKMLACGFVPNSVQGKRGTARLVRYDQRRKVILRCTDSGRCFDAELRSKQEFRNGEAIVRLERRHDWLGFANPEVTQSLLLENAFSSGDIWCRSGDLMDVDRLGFFYFVETLG